MGVWVWPQPYNFDTLFSMDFFFALILMYYHTICLDYQGFLVPFYIIQIYPDPIE